MDTAALVFVVCALLVQAGANAAVMASAHAKKLAGIQTAVGWVLAACELVAAAIVWRAAFP